MSPQIFEYIPSGPVEWRIEIDLLDRLIDPKKSNWISSCRRMVQDSRFKGSRNVEIVFRILNRNQKQETKFNYKCDSMDQPSLIIL